MALQQLRLETAATSGLRVPASRYSTHRSYSSPSRRCMPGTILVSRLRINCQQASSAPDASRVWRMAGSTPSDQKASDAWGMLKPIACIRRASSVQIERHDSAHPGKLLEDFL